MSNNKSAGTSVVTLVLAAFIVMKVGAIGPVANWSWWWVFSPLWLTILAVTVMAAIAAVIAVIVDHLRR